MVAKSVENGAQYDGWNGTENFVTHKAALNTINSGSWRDQINHEDQQSASWHETLERFAPQIHNVERGSNNAPIYRKTPYHRRVARGENYVMPPRHFRSNFTQGPYRGYCQVDNKELPQCHMQHVMVHQPQEKAGMGSSMKMSATCPLAPSRYLKNAGTKAWVSYLSENGRRGMPNRSETTNADMRCWTPGTIARNRRETYNFDNRKMEPPNGGPKQENSLRAKLSQERNQLTGDLDPDLLAKLLRPPEERRANAGKKPQAYPPPAKAMRLPKHGEELQPAPEGRKRKNTAGVAYHGNHGTAELLGMGSAVPFGGIVDEHQRWLTGMQQGGTKGLPQQSNSKWETGIRALQ